MQGGTDTVLVVDDEPDLLENCRRILLRAGYGCYVAGNGTEGLKVLQRESPTLAFIDLRMPDIDGLELLGRIRKSSPRTPVVLITAYASVQTAVEAMTVGAFDYLPKPFTAERLLDTVARALEFTRQQESEVPPHEPLLDACGMVGESREIRAVLETVARVARSEANVLICGETGSGKELVARMLHRNSPRSAMPFVPLDCVSLADSLLESELFGHERGAYTDAKEQRPGLLETANGGVLFLDEVAELSLSTQAKLLRALQEKEVRRVGGRKLVPINIRVLSATNKNLSELIRAGRFREDLHYRLNVVTIRVPPLRERSGDIRLLAHHFFTTFQQRQSNRALLGVSEAAHLILEQYPWPGNVRELCNVMERAVSLIRGHYVAPGDLPEELLVPAAGDPRSVGKFQSRKREMIEHFERHYLQELMERTDGNVTRAAELASMLRPALQRLLRRHSIDPAHYR
jgi:two-component system, NtrC family, response regulator HydG